MTTPETFDANQLIVQPESRSHEGKKIPYGKILYNNGAAQPPRFTLKFDGLVHISAAFKGQYDKGSRLSVFISFPDSMVFRGKAYEMPKNKQHAEFLRDVFLPSIFDQVDLLHVKRGLGISSFNRSDVTATFKNQWLHNKNGTWGFFASVSLEDLPDKNFGRTVVLSMLKNKDGVAVPTPVPNEKLKVNEWLARIESLGFEITAKDGKANIRARLDKFIVSNAQESTGTIDPEMAAQVANETPDDLGDFLSASSEPTPKNGTLQGNALMADITTVDPSEMLSL